MAPLVLCLVLLASLASPGRAATVDQVYARLTKLQQSLDSLMRQATLQQLFIEEKIRGEGDSGVVKARLFEGGTRPYHSNTHNSRWTPGAIWGNPFYSKTLNHNGFMAVLNGIHFRTEAGRIDIKQSHRTSKEFKAVEEVDPPEVPPSVWKKNTVWEQTNEMIEYFRAFRDNNFGHRDFRPYFKPLLCYLEGFWQKMDPTEGKYFNDEYDTSIPRHQFQSMNGARYTFDPYSELNPVKDFNRNVVRPRLGKFKSRILCQPLKHYLLPNRLRVVDEMSAARVSFNNKLENLKTHAGARFTVNPTDSPTWTDKHYRAGLLDQLMYEIPGMDNHGATLEDRTLGSPVYPYGQFSENLLNTGYYHRYYNVRQKGAMGQQVRHRSYSDSSIFMAQHSQSSNLTGMSVEACFKRPNKPGGQVCKKYFTQWSYAIPLAIVYQTPLQNWNPLNIQMKSDSDLSVTANGRKGGFTAAKAFNGANAYKCATIPPELYDSDIHWDKVKGVLDKTGKVVRARTCGIKTIIPRVRGVGDIRTVYPIYPTHVEGSAEYKEVTALTDVVMESARKLGLMRN